MVSAKQKESPFDKKHLSLGPVLLCGTPECNGCVVCKKKTLGNLSDLLIGSDSFGQTLFCSNNIFWCLSLRYLD